MDKLITNNTPSSEAPFLTELFRCLGESSFSYCVLRNYEALPSSLDGSDLDLLVLPDDRDGIADLVKEVAGQCGGKVIADYATGGRFIKLLGCYEGQWWGCAVDLLAGIDYRGMVYVSSSPMLLRSEDYKGIKVASAADIEVMALLKELVNNGKTRKNYFSEAVESHQKWGDQSLEILRETFSNDLIAKFKVMLEKQPERDAPLSKIAKAMRHEIWAKHGVVQAGALVKNLLCRIKRIWQPPGCSLAVTGTDGSGKTTVIKSIEPVLERAIHTEIKYEHMRPNWLKALGVATGKRSVDDGDVVEDPHGKKPSGFFGSLIRLGYYTVDYLFGYWVKIYPQLIKRVNLYLFDRYCYDMIIDPLRMRIKLPSRLIQIVFSIVPKPSLVLCLGGDPEKIYARKPETSLEEVKKQVADLKSFCEKERRAVWIDTDCEIKESKNQALSAVLEAMSERYQ